MKFKLFPANSFGGSLDSLSGQSEGLVTPVGNVVDCIARTKGTLVRISDYAVTVDIEQESLDQVMPCLRGWIAQPVRNTSRVTAYEGMLDYHLGTGRS